MVPQYLGGFLLDFSYTTVVSVTVFEIFDVKF